MPHNIVNVGKSKKQEIIWRIRELFLPLHLIVCPCVDRF